MNRKIPGVESRQIVMGIVDPSPALPQFRKIVMKSGASSETAPLSVVERDKCFEIGARKPMIFRLNKRPETTPITRLDCPKVLMPFQMPSVMR